MRHFRHARLATAEVGLLRLVEDYLLWRKELPTGEIDDAKAEEIDEVIMALERIAGYVWAGEPPWAAIPF